MSSLVLASFQELNSCSCNQDLYCNFIHSHWQCRLKIRCALYLAYEWRAQIWYLNLQGVPKKGIDKELLFRAAQGFNSQFIERCFLYVFFSKFKIPFNKFDKTDPDYSKLYSVTNSWNRVTQKHFWNLIAVFLLNLNAKKHIRLWKLLLLYIDAFKSFKWCTKQNLQIYWIQINSKTVNWSLEQFRMKVFYRYLFYGTPCIWNEWSGNEPDFDSSLAPSCDPFFPTLFRRTSEPGDSKGANVTSCLKIRVIL